MKDETTILEHEMSEHMKRDLMLAALSEMDVILMSDTSLTFEDAMSSALMPIAVASDTDRMLIYKHNSEKDCFGQVYRWDKASGGTVSVDEELVILPNLPAITEWISILKKGGHVNIECDTMTRDEAFFLDQFNVKALMLFPVFINKELWGGVAFQRHNESRLFEENIGDFLNYASRLSVSAFIRHENALKEERSLMEIKRREETLDALNKASIAILAWENKSFADAMSESLSYIAEPLGLHRISVWRNNPYDKNKGLSGSQIYRWDRASEGTTVTNPSLQNILYSKLAPSWEAILSRGGTFNGPIETIPDFGALKLFKVVSTYITPVFIKGEFWGFVMFEDRENSRYFEDYAVKMMESAAFLCANNVIRNDMEHELIESEATREANKLSELMLNTTPLACRLWRKEDGKFKIFRCNDKAVELFGLKSKTEYYKRFYEFSPEFQPDGKRSSDTIGRILEETFKKGRMVFEWMHKFIDGTELPVEITLVKVNYNGEDIIAGYTRDLREMKSLMNIIHEESEKLLASAHWYEEILDAIPFGITVQDVNKNFNYFNTTAERAFGKKREDLIGNPCCNLGLEICNTPNCSIECALRGKFRTYFIHNNVTYQSDVHTLRDFDENIIGFIEVIQDITKMEHMARQQAEAEAANKAKSNFLSTMSHEMRTPLNAVIGMTSIGKNTEDVNKKNYALSKIGDASSHLLGVINDVLDMAKIEANKLELSPIEYNFDKMLQRVMDFVNYKVDEKNQRLSISIDNRIPRFVVGDDQRLAQVITNLLSNAVKFTPENGKISLNAELVSECDDVCEIRVEVSDNGIGMSPEYKSKM
ncbi:MAG: PAS domain S-box protein, partial [Oscillospiraceae bacterium]|nr:PAS domain S-box protein [Oscillospiraceae bacterium]